MLTDVKNRETCGLLGNEQEILGGADDLGAPGEKKKRKKKAVIKLRKETTIHSRFLLET